MVNELWVSDILPWDATLAHSCRMGYDWTMPTLPYDAKWKAHRRIFSKFFSASNPSAYQPRVTEFVRLLLPELLENPNDFIAQIKQYVLPQFHSDILPFIEFVE